MVHGRLIRLAGLFGHRVQATVHLHRQHVFAVLQLACHIYPQRPEDVGVSRDLLAVQIHDRVEIQPLEHEPCVRLNGLLRGFEFPAVHPYLLFHPPRRLRIEAIVRIFDESLALQIEVDVAGHQSVNERSLVAFGSDVLMRLSVRTVKASRLPYAIEIKMLQHWFS